MGWDCKYRKWVLEELLQWRMSTSVHFTCTRFIISKYKFCFVWNYFTAAPHLQKRHWTAGVQRFRALLGLCHMMLVVLSVRVAGSMLTSNCAQWRTWWNCRQQFHWFDCWSTCQSHGGLTSAWNKPHYIIKNLIGMHLFCGWLVAW